jgi:hypothetical protein
MNYEINEKTLQNEILEGNNFIVGVYQNKGGKKLELVNIWYNLEFNKNQFTCFLYRMTIQKDKNLKVKYQYNYSDKQTITFRETYTNFDGTETITEYRFFNVPTKLGYLDIV